MWLGGGCVRSNTEPQRGPEPEPECGEGGVIEESEQGIWRQ